MVLARIALYILIQNFLPREPITPVRFIENSELPYFFSSMLAPRVVQSSPMMQKDNNMPIVEERPLLGCQEDDSDNTSDMMIKPCSEKSSPRYWIYAVALQIVLLLGYSLISLAIIRRFVDTTSVPDIHGQKPYFPSIKNLERNSMVTNIFPSICWTRCAVQVPIVRQLRQQPLRWRTDT